MLHGTLVKSPKFSAISKVSYDFLGSKIMNSDTGLEECGHILIVHV